VFICNAQSSDALTRDDETSELLSVANVATVSDETRRSVGQCLF